MPNQDEVLRKASEVAAATQLLQQLIKGVTDTETESNQASVALANAPEADKKTAQATLDQKTKAVEQAKKRKDEAQALLENLLQPKGAKRNVEWIYAFLPYFVFGGLALVFIWYLMTGITDGKLLPVISVTAAARGLITFMVVLVAMSIALILVLSTILSDTSDRRQRFSEGKEVLTALIGVLGTIVGFYFGQSTVEIPKGVNVQSVTISKQNPVAGDKVTIGATIVGGKAPYSYDVTFQPPVITGVKPAESADGHLEIKFDVPAVSADSEVNFLINVKDSEGKTVVYDSRADAKALHLKGPPAGTKNAK